MAEGLLTQTLNVKLETIGDLMLCPTQLNPGLAHTSLPERQRLNKVKWGSPCFSK